MKAIIKNEESGVYEIAKRIFFPVQLLIVGISIPLLFAIGISNHNGKKPVKTEENIEINTSQFSSHPISELSIARL
jgi:hypothetical protein